jgi:signal transduction histidine kinase
LRITDDGKGIPSGRLMTSTSHGLVSMRHRIAGLGGAWDVGSPVTGGTMITARIPLARMLPQNALEGGEHPLASVAL